MAHRAATSLAWDEPGIGSDVLLLADPRIRHAKATTNAAAQAPTMERIMPGMIRTANPAVPVTIAITILAIAFVVMATTIGNTASGGDIFPPATNEAKEIAAA